MCASGGLCPSRVTTSSQPAALFLMAVTNLLSSYHGMNAIAISTHGQNIFFLCPDMLVSLSGVDEIVLTEQKTEPEQGGRRLSRTHNSSKETA